MIDKSKGLRRLRHRLGQTAPAFPVQEGPVGEPEGGPAKARNLKADLVGELGARIRVREGDREVSYFETRRPSSKRSSREALKGDARASSLLVGLMAKLLDVEAVPVERGVDASEKAIIDAYVARRFAKAAIPSKSASRRQGGLRRSRRCWRLRGRYSLNSHAFSNPFVSGSKCQIATFLSPFCTRTSWPSSRARIRRGRAACHARPVEDYIRLLAHELTALAAGDTAKRLILSLPPRHLKSLLTSVFLPAWMLGRDPRLRFIIVSHQMDLATLFSRPVRQIVASDWYAEVFPRTASSAPITTRRPSSSRRSGGASGQPPSTPASPATAPTSSSWMILSTLMTLPPRWLERT